MHCSFITLLKCRFHPSTELNLQLHLWKWQLGTGITFPQFQIGVCPWDAVLFSNLRDQQTSGAVWVCIFYLYHAEGLPESMLGTCSVWKETPGLWWWWLRTCNQKSNPEIWTLLPPWFSANINPKRGDYRPRKVMSLQCSFGIWKWQIELLDAISFFLCKAFFAVILLWSPFVARWATLFSVYLKVTCMLLALRMQVPLGLMQGRVKVIKHFSKWEPYNSSLLELKVAEVIKFSQDMQLPRTLGFSFKMLRFCDMLNQGPHAGWLICCISLLAQSFWGTCAVTMSGWWGPGVYLFAWDT